MKALLACLALIACSPLLAADCTYPNPPETMPDGNTATEGEMLAAMTMFKQYNSNVTAYLTCLEQETSDKVRDAGRAAGLVVHIKALQSKKHNSALRELKDTTGTFNDQVRTFKARK